MFLCFKRGEIIRNIIQYICLQQIQQEAAANKKDKKKKKTKHLKHNKNKPLDCVALTKASSQYWKCLLPPIVVKTFYLLQ